MKDQFLVCTLSEKTIEEIFLEIEAAKKYADFFEIRFDQVREISLEKIKDLMEKTRVSFIFTFRKKEEGGASSICEEERLHLIENLFSLNPSFFDLEVSTDGAFLEKMKRLYPNTKLIGSIHDFEKTPLDLDALLSKMKSPYFFSYKMAFHAEKGSDCLRLMHFLKNKAGPLRLSAISMGKFGKASRVLGPLFGNFFSYSSLKEEKNLHRIDLRTLFRVYNYPHLHKETGIYALLGENVEKSVGHLFHNLTFQKEKLGKIYIKLEVEKEDLKKCLFYLRKLSFQGLSITAPLKEEIIPLLDEIEEDAKKIGAVNTVLCQKGQLKGFNTDGKGALDAIERSVLVRGKKIAILGAGGASRAIAFEAKARGAFVTIYNRTFEKAKRIAERFHLKALPLKSFGNTPYNVIIQTISEEIDEHVLKGMSKNAFVMDIKYKPKRTQFLKRGALLNCRLVFGREMFLNQARLQQEIFALSAK